MDEATANIDIKTDEIIQSTIKKMMKQSTVLTIAHRIKTIVNYDRILVLDSGEMIEFDSPQNLLLNENSFFFKLYKNANI